MKTIQYTLLSILFVFASCKNSGEKSAAEQALTDSEKIDEISETADLESDAKKRYEVKSGTIVYTAPMGVVQTLTWDNYGLMEVFVTELEMAGITSKDIQIRRDGYQYSFKAGETTGTKTKWYTNDMHFSKMDMEAMKKYKVKKLADETIAGRKCEKYSAEFGGSPMTTWVWGNIMMKTITKFGTGEMIIEATKIEEGPVAASIFEIPANITFSEV
ncbi:MAG: hypothetical protein IPM71_05380 [Bacteroidota bacterium]|nr:MAG: hypothetical protein IPM71_05380 [Bacteroidota bacterium]